MQGIFITLEAGTLIICDLETSFPPFFNSLTHPSMGSTFMWLWFFNCFAWPPKNKRG